MDKKKLTSGRFDPRSFFPEKYFTIYLSHRTELFTHMTARPIVPESRRRPVCAAVALVLVMVAVLLAAGCIGQAVNEKTTSGTPNQQFPTTAATIPTPTRSPGSVTLSTESEPEYIVNNIRDVLFFWDEKFHWDLSPAQIEEYAQSMENGTMKKYMTKPDYPTVLIIPDKHQFYREVGGALGFTQSESEDFLRALDDYQRQAYQTCPSWEKCGTPKPIVLNFSVKPRPVNTAP